MGVYHLRDWSQRAGGGGIQGRDAHTYAGGYSGGIQVGDANMRHFCLGIQVFSRASLACIQMGYSGIQPALS